MEGQFQVYKDMQARTNGEIYIGVVGPVRTGKSTFIKRFMDLLVIPNMQDVHSRERAIDELPQSAAGKTIMTTEPKFIPKEAAEIRLSEDVQVKIRLIDCVGFMVDGASGHMEEEQERMVKTPWFDHEISFSKAAEIGTKKVINEHSTIGVVVTTDGSFGELPREKYVEPEERTVEELRKLSKPFVILLNSSHPYDSETKDLAVELTEKFKTAVIPMNCEQLRKEDVTALMQGVLSVFPVCEIGFYMPKWIGMLPTTHPLKAELVETMRGVIEKMVQIKDATSSSLQTDNPYIKNMKIEQIDMRNGNVRVQVDIKEEYYYQTVSDMIGVNIAGERELLQFLREMAGKRTEYDKMAVAGEEVRQKGYGVVTPCMEEIQVEEPEIIKHGSKYGVKIKAVAPSVHMIKANIETEIAPIVGSEEQAKDLIAYISENSKGDPAGIWSTNIFGKSIRQLIEDGIQNKVSKLTDESQIKLQDTIQKVVNDSNGGLVCIII